MASEILRTPESSRALPSSIQRVATGIAKAAGVQAREVIDRAIQSFNGITSNEKQPWFDETVVQAAGHADHPSKYFIQANGKMKNLNGSGIIPMDQLLSKLRRSDLNFQRGVSSFLKSGIQEALGSLKIIPDPKIQHPEIPIPLDELISPEKLRNPDRTKLQTSVQVIDEMFITLKKVQSDVSDLRLRMLSSVRA
jgi:hypothetical protein